MKLPDPPVPFRDSSLWIQALTHPSWSNERGGAHYERLEHLGDAVLALSVTTLFLEHLDQSAEGDLTHLRQQVVNSAALAEVARERGLDALIRLGAGANAEGSRSSASVLSDVVEAVVGAVYQDAGFEAAHALVREWLGGRIGALAAAGAQAARHPKSALQEKTQRELGAAPLYAMVSQEGPPHAPRFTVEVRVAERTIGSGEGSSLKEAERIAAMDALQHARWRT